MRTEPFVITDHMWEVMDPLRSGSERDQGVIAKETRLFTEMSLLSIIVSCGVFPVCPAPILCTSLI